MNSGGQSCSGMCFVKKSGLVCGEQHRAGRLSRYRHKPECHIRHLDPKTSVSETLKIMKKA